MDESGQSTLAVSISFQPLVYSRVEQWRLEIRSMLEDQKIQILHELWVVEFNSICIY